MNHLIKTPRLYSELKTHEEYERYILLKKEKLKVLSKQISEMKEYILNEYFKDFISNENILFSFEINHNSIHINISLDRFRIHSTIIDSELSLIVNANTNLNSSEEFSKCLEISSLFNLKLETLKNEKYKYLNLMRSKIKKINIIENELDNKKKILKLSKNRNILKTIERVLIPQYKIQKINKDNLFKFIENNFEEHHRCYFFEHSVYILDNNILSFNNEESLEFQINENNRHYYAIEGVEVSEQKFINHLNKDLCYLNNKIFKNSKDLTEQIFIQVQEIESLFKPYLLQNNSSLF